MMGNESPGDRKKRGLRLLGGPTTGKNSRRVYGCRKTTLATCAGGRCRVIDRLFAQVPWEVAAGPFQKREIAGEVTPPGPKDCRIYYAEIIMH